MTKKHIYDVTGCDHDKTESNFTFKTEASGADGFSRLSGFTETVLVIREFRWENGDVDLTVVSDMDWKVFRSALRKMYPERARVIDVRTMYLDM